MSSRAAPESKERRSPATKKSVAAVRSAVTYVYCVVKSVTSAKSAKSAKSTKSTKSVKTAPPSSGATRVVRALEDGAPRGLINTDKLRLLDAEDGYWLVVTSAPLALYSAEAIDEKLRDLDWVGGRAAEHEAVVEHAANVGTVIPMKLFTIFATDERALDHVRKMKRSLDRVVDRIEGCEEWGLTILFDEARAARAAAEEARSKKVVSGTGFLMRKKALDVERRTAGARGAAQVDELYDVLAKIARRAQRRAAPNRELAGRVLLDAVFLVPHALVKKIKSTVAASAKKLVAEGFDVRLTGPWPAYSFIGGR